MRRSPVSAAQLAAIVDLIGEGTISGKIAKDLFEIVWQEGGDPRALVEARGMKQVTDLGAIEKVVDDIIAANPDKVAQAQGQAAADRLVRRPGDEVVRRQGQPASRQRSAQVQARHLNVASDVTRGVIGRASRSMRRERASIVRHNARGASRDEASRPAESAARDSSRKIGFGERR